MREVLPIETNAREVPIDFLCELDGPRRERAVVCTVLPDGAPR